MPDKSRFWTKALKTNRCRVHTYCVQRKDQRKVQVDEEEKGGQYLLAIRWRNRSHGRHQRDGKDKHMKVTGTRRPLCMNPKS